MKNVIIAVVCAAMAIATPVKGQRAEPSLSSYTEAKRMFNDLIVDLRVSTTLRISIQAKIERALTKGDETLIEVAVTDAYKNQKSLERLASVIKLKGELSFRKASKDAYWEKIISEEQYTADLDLFESTMAKAQNTTPPDGITTQLQLIKNKRPSIINMCEKVYGPWPGL